LFDSKAFRKIWKDNKLTNNQELRTWVEFSPFNKNETIRLHNSLKKSTKSIRFLSLLVEQLESYAESNPQLTLKCLDLIIHSISEDPEIHMASENLKNVLRILLKSKNKNTSKKAESLIHYLGELGYNEYQDLIKK
jgi:hypothetical protein